jgi:pimeloyl-ACP methyl ester carboxylesterase
VVRFPAGLPQSARPVKERVFTVFGRKLASLCQGEPGQTPVLALHGWLDNAESFRALAERMPGVHLVALDLAGHGRSDHRAADGDYNIWSDLPDIQAVADELGWDAFGLLGHSRGALMATLFAAALPERVTRLALLDAASPRPVLAADCPAQLAAYLRDKKRLLDRQGRVFASREEAIALRVSKGLGQRAAELIATRNLVETEGGWRWSTDARLQGASAFKLTDAHNTAIMAALAMPSLMILAEGGFGADVAAAATASPAMAVEFVPGGHHCHMDESADRVANRLLQFFTGEHKQ